MSATAAVPHLRFSQVCADLLRAKVPVRFAAPGHSMHPAIRDGETVHVAPCDPATLLRGEVVLALAPGGPIAHRLLRRLPDGRLQLRGDALAAPDEPFAPANCLGRVVAVERHGRLCRPGAAAARLRATAHRTSRAAWRTAVGVGRRLRRIGRKMWIRVNLPSGSLRQRAGDRCRVNQGGAG